MKLSNQINLLTLYPNKNDATSLYRGVGPISKLHNTFAKYKEHLNVFEETKFTWASVSKADIAFFQRPFGKNYFDGAQIVKDNGVPLWIDFDDILFPELIPDYNTAKYYFSNPEDRDPFIEILKMADVISVTTESIKDILIEYNKNIVIIPNAFDDYRFNLERKISNRGIINWRGSNTHLNDILEIEDVLCNVKMKHKDWVFHFIGTDAEKLKKLECNVTKPTDPIKYFKLIKELFPRIQIVPLVDNLFNKCKSNIGWIEAIYSGAVAIAPLYLPEFNKPGVIRYNNNKEFEELLNRCIEDIRFTNDNYDKSFDYINDKLLLSKINERRYSLISHLLN